MLKHDIPSVTLILILLCGLRRAPFLLALVPSRRLPSLSHVGNRPPTKLTLCDHRTSRLGALTASPYRNKSIIVSRDRVPQDDGQHGQMRNDEPGDHHRVVPQLVEFRVREREDDGEDGAADVAEEDG